MAVPTKSVPCTSTALALCHVCSVCQSPVKCGDQTLHQRRYCSAATMTPSAWGYPRAEVTHRNHHAGQVRLNSSGAGITRVGPGGQVLCDTCYACMGSNNAYGIGTSVSAHAGMRIAYIVTRGSQVCMYGLVLFPSTAARYSIRRISFPVSSITTRTKISLKIQAPQKKRKRLYRACTHRAARTTQCSPATPLPFFILSPKQWQHTPPLFLQ